MQAHEFRRLFSAWLLEHPSLLEKLPQLPLLFQRSAEGERLNSTSNFRYESRTQQQWIHGIGPEASSLLQSLGQEIKLLDKQPSFSSAMALESSPITLTNNFPQRYTAAQLITCKNAEQYKRWQACEPEEKLARIASVLEQGLNTQLDMLRPQTKRTGLSPSDLEMQFEWAMPKLQSIQSKAYVRVVTCSFTLPCTLQGSWAAGPLTNKGFGNITKA